MADVSTAYSADVLASPAGAESDENQWIFSVPAQPDSTSPIPRTTHDSVPGHTKARDHGSNLSQGSTQSKLTQNHESGVSRGRRDQSLGRTEGGRARSRDIYKHGATSRNASHAKSSADQQKNGSHKKGDGGKGYGGGGGDDDDDDPEHANWIHRDKLAKIESEELQRAAILYKRRVRSGSKGSAIKGPGHESHPSGTDLSIASPPSVAAGEHSEPWPSLRDEQADPLDSTAALEDDHNDGNGDEPDSERMNWDLRLPEEIAAEERQASDSSSGIYRHPGLRKSSSRIPIATTSPVPISPEQLGREFPIPRSRTLTNEDQDNAPFAMPRRASEPVALEDTGSPAHAGSRPNSRGVASTTKKSPPKAAPGSATRKTSAPPTTRRPAAKQRTTSGGSGSESRPTTRSGKKRPINRPEGDPPWLATMYKPDPRLPPDQQIVPTHARKMQQEQWEKNGEAGTAYDRDFAPIAIHSGPQSPLGPPADATDKEESKPDEMLAPRTPEPTTRPSTSTGYSPMPKIQSSPALGLTPAANWNPPEVTAPPPPPKEKGCGCCVVM